MIGISKLHCGTVGRRLGKIGGISHGTAVIF